MHESPDSTWCFAGCAADCRRHVLPFQSSTSAPRPELPTAVHLAAEAHHTPFRPVSESAGRGQPASGGRLTRGRLLAALCALLGVCLLG
ncbi:MAG TPA: hypothetical protein VGL63_03910 [Streptosporangiaceae bacterium]